MTRESAKSGICRLCGKHGELCHSHIIPEFCHSACYEGPKKQAILVHFSEENKSVKPLKVQVGRREFLLCNKCETIISKYEGWFRKYWYGPAGLPQQVHTSPLILECPDIDIFRLFHLSVLLRASLSGKFFRAVSLGDHYEAILAKSVLTGKVPPHSHFPIMGCVLVDDKGYVMHHLIVGAIRGIHPNNRTRAYHLTYAGCEWVFVVTDHPSREDAVVAETISPTGKIMLSVSHHRESMTGHNFITQFRKARWR